MKIFKQIAAVTTAVVMAAGTMCVDAFAADTYKLYVSSDSAKAAVGDTVKVSVLIDTPDDGISVLGYHLEFDTDYLEYQTGTAKAGIGGDQTLNDMANVNVNSATDGWIGFAYMSEGAKTGAAVESLSLEFKVLKPNAQLSLTQIEVAAADFNSTDITDKGTIGGAEIACSHKTTEKKTTPATCAAEGKEETVCKDCEEIIKTEVLPKTEDHDWGEWTTKEDVKCGETADQTRTCKLCGKKENQPGKVVEHAWNDGEITSEPTCTKDGVKTYTCTREGCGETKTEAIKALGHDMDEGTVTKEPNCTEKGEKVYSCKREGCDEKKTEEIAALGHKLPEDKELIEEPTCYDDGKEKSVCERCNEEVITDIPALGHSWGEWEVTKAPTVNEEGEEARECGMCGERETRAIAKLPSESGAPSYSDGGVHIPETTAPNVTPAESEAPVTAATTPTAPVITRAPEATEAESAAAVSSAAASADNTAAVTNGNVGGNTDNKDSDGNSSTGVVIAVVPAIAAAIGTIVFRKRK